MTTSHPLRRALGLAAAGALVVGAAACGDDDEDAGAATTEAAAADLEAYCDASVEIEQAFAEVDFADSAALQAAAADAQPLIDRIVETSPEEVAPLNQVFADVIAEVAETGDPSAFDGEAVAEATEAVHAHDLERCAWNVVEVTAEDYRFEAEFPTAGGPASFELTNAGAEPHVLIVARKLDGVEGSALEAFEALEGEEDFPASFEEVGSAFAAPGASGHGIMDLPSGEYVVFCPIPVGAGPDGEGEGPPHFVQGMVSTFEVG